MQNHELTIEALLLSLCLEGQFATQTKKERTLSSCPSEQVTCFGRQARISPASSFYNSQVNGARHQNPPGQVWEDYPAYSLLSTLTLFTASYFLPVTNMTKGVGHAQSGLLPAGSRPPQRAFSRTVPHLNVPGPLACLF